ncbi:MAG: serine/threonine protein kinase [Deltaproteobacteria bacterium]|nr:serine/threonine protein kinase [Deltaproteobacteria bacterium]
MRAEPRRQRTRNPRRKKTLLFLFKVDGYRAIEKIGSGVTADVFLVEDRESDAFLALKIMSEKARHHAHELTRFKRAVKLMRSLEHPAIVKLVDFGAYRRAPYMVMDFFDGGTLKQLLARSGALPPVAAVMIAESILKALFHAYAMNIVHRDLKPENILLSLDGKVAISDFGLAWQHGQDTPEQEALAQAGETLGSAPCMAPEQVVGKKVDARADLFSVGVVLYEMLTGTSPFQAETFGFSF